MAKNKSASQTDALVESQFMVMVDLLNKHNNPDKPLIGTSKGPGCNRHLPFPFELPPEAFKPSDWDDNEDYYLPGERELMESGGQHTSIYFADGEQYINGEEFTFGRMVAMVKSPFSGESVTLYMSGLNDDSISAGIKIGSVGNNPPRAFFSAKCEDDKWCYFEAEEFYMLSVTDETLAREEGVFTLFNKKAGILVTRHVYGATGFKEASLMSKPYPKTAVSYKMTDREEEFIRERFGELVGRYARFVKSSTAPKSKPVPPSSGEGSPFDALLSVKQGLSQEKMKDICRVMRRNGRRGRTYTEFSFKDIARSGDWRTGPNEHAEMMFKALGNTVHSFSLREGNGLNAVIIIGEIAGSTSAFLVFKREDGVEYICELDWFSLLTIHCKRENGHLGVLTVFNSVPNVLCFDYCVAYPEQYLLRLDKKDFPPLSAEEKKEFENEE